MFKITQKEWDKTSNNYKSIIEGVKYIMGVEIGCLTPVEIAEDGHELESYLFDEYGITYSLIAWGFDDARRIIKESGHYKITNLRLKNSTLTINEEKQESTNMTLVKGMYKNTSFMLEYFLDNSYKISGDFSEVDKKRLFQEWLNKQ